MPKSHLLDTNCTAAGSGLIKLKLDTVVRVNNNEVMKEQRHSTNEIPNMYINIFNLKEAIF